MSFGPTSNSDRSAERGVRLTVLEVLTAKRRVEPNSPGMFPGELEKLIGVPQEHLEFSTWYLIQKGLVQRSDSSRLVVTASGVDYLDESPHVNRSALRLQARAEQSVA